MKKEMRDMKKRLITAVVIVAASVSCLFSSSAPAVHDHSFSVTMGILTERDMIMGFSDRLPNEGGTLVSFNEGTLEVEGENAVGTFYVYHITNLPEYKVKMIASPMQAYDKETHELVPNTYKGYKISMKDAPNSWKDVHFGSLDGPTTIEPSAAGMDAPAFFNGNDYIFHGNETENDRGNDDWWRTFKIIVPLYTEGDPIDFRYEWKGSVKLMYEGK